MLKPKTSLQTFLFRPETKVLVCSSLIGFAINKWISQMQDLLVSQAVLKTISPIYNNDQIENIINNSSLTKPPENLPTTTSFLVNTLQLIFNLLVIYLVFCFFEKFEVPDN